MFLHFWYTNGFLNDCFSMIQEIIVFSLFAFIIGFYLYRLFSGKETKPSGGCSKCTEFKEHSPSPSGRKE